MWHEGGWSELASLKSGYNSVVGLCVPLFTYLMGCCWASFPTSKQWRWTGSLPSAPPLLCPEDSSWFGGESWPSLLSHPGVL